LPGKHVIQMLQKKDRQYVEGIVYWFDGTVTVLEVDQDHVL